MALAIPSASVRSTRTSALEARRGRGLRWYGEGAQVTATVSKAHDLLPRCSQEICATMVQPLDLRHIGGAAHFVWAYPPNFGRTAHRHVQVQRRTTVEYPTGADALIETHISKGILPTFQRGFYTLNGMRDTSAARTSPTSLRTTARLRQPNRMWPHRTEAATRPHFGRQNGKKGLIRAVLARLARICHAYTASQWFCNVFSYK